MKIVKIIKYNNYLSKKNSIINSYNLYRMRKFRQKKEEKFDFKLKI